MTSGPAGTPVTITGTNLGSSQGTSTVTFNGTAATVTTWSATSIATSGPSAATTGSVIVTVGGVASNGVTFTVTGSAPAPTITSLSTTSGPVGTAVTITGTSFGSSQGTNTVTFNGTTATVTSWGAASIVTSVPSGATTGNVGVTVGGVASNGVNFTVSSGSGLSWGPMNSWIQMNTSSPGTTLTTSILNTATIGGSVTWSLSTTPITGLAVGPSQGSMGGSITVAGTTYPIGTTTQSMALNNGVTAPLYVSKNNDFGGYPTVVANGFITFGPPNAGYSGQDFDYVSLTDWNGNYVILELNNGDADGLGGCYCVRIETNGNGTIYSSNTAITPGHRYSYSLLFDEVGGTAKLALYDPSNSFAQVGSTMTVAQKTGSILAKWFLGNSEGGTASGYTSYFEDSMLDWTNHTFPNYPQAGVTSPSITSLSTTSGPAGTAVTITGTNFGSSQGTSTVTFNGTTATVTSWGAASIVTSVPTGATTGNVVVMVGGVASNGVNFTVSPTAAPVITSATTASGTVGTAFSYQITATNTPTSYGATGLPAGLSVSSTSGLISGTPTAAGTSTVTLSAANASGTGQATLTLTVSAAAPVITSATTASGTVGTAFSYQITATNTPTSFGATGLPAGLSVSSTSGLISGTPTAAGTSTVTLSAANASGTGQATLTLTVSAAAPVITSATTASGTVGTAFSYQITATNTPTSFGATGLPAGLSVSSTSGLISGTPTASGTSTVTLSATNGGGTGNATLTLTIAAAAPVITSATTANGTVGTAFSYQITATNTPTSYGATGLPTGLSVNTTSGLISGTPTTAATSTVTLSATNSTGTGHANLTLTVTTGGAVSSAQTIAAQSPSSAASLSLSFLTNTVAGDLIMVAFDYDTNTVPSSVTDSQGNTFTQVGSQLTSPGATRSVVYYAKNIKGGADTVTVNLSGTSAWLELYLSEYTGVNQTNPIDVQAGAAGSAGAGFRREANRSAGGVHNFRFGVGD